ncbi:hypothetical protein A2U01_0061104, partial [Trifolium medium]|nr:hypothetical protein [Trifolium medium]
GEVDDERSLVVPFETSDAAEEDSCGGEGENSGEDEVSGDELDVDVKRNQQHGGRSEAESERQKVRGICVCGCQKKRKEL